MPDVDKEVLKNVTKQSLYNTNSIWLERVYSEGVGNRVYGISQINSSTITINYMDVSDLYDDTKQIKVNSISIT